MSGPAGPHHFSHRKSPPDHVETAAAAYMKRGRRTKSSMLSVIIVIHLMLVLGLIAVVLLQKSEGRGAGQLDQRLHDRPRYGQRAHPAPGRFLAAGFFVTSLLLSWIAGFEAQAGLDHPHRRRAAQETPGAPPAAPPIQRRWRRSRPAQERPGRQHGASASAGPGRTASAAVAIGDFATHLRLQRAGRATTLASPLRISVEVLTVQAVLGTGLDRFTMRADIPENRWSNGRRGG